MFKVQTVLNAVSGLDVKILIASVYTPLSDCIFRLCFTAISSCEQCYYYSCLKT